MCNVDKQIPASCPGYGAEAMVNVCFFFEPKLELCRAVCADVCHLTQQLVFLFGFPERLETNNR